MLLFILISASLLTTLTSVVIPIITGLLTKYTLPSWVKGFITLVLNAVSALIDTNMQDDGTALLSGETLQKALIGFVISVAMYAGIYGPAKLTSSKLGGKLFPHKGIGPSDNS